MVEPNLGNRRSQTNGNANSPRQETAESQHSLDRPRHESARPPVVQLHADTGAPAQLAQRDRRGRSAEGGPLEVPSGPDEPLRYRSGAFTVSLNKDRRRWHVTVNRDDDVIGVDVIDLASAKARAALLADLPGVSREEFTVLE